MLRWIVSSLVLLLACGASAECIKKGGSCLSRSYSARMGPHGSTITNARDAQCLRGDSDAGLACSTGGNVAWELMAIPVFADTSIRLDYITCMHAGADATGFDTSPDDEVQLCAGSASVTAGSDTGAFVSRGCVSWTASNVSATMNGNMIHANINVILPTTSEILAVQQNIITDANTDISIESPCFIGWTVID